MIEIDLLKLIDSAPKNKLIILHRLNFLFLTKICMLVFRMVNL